MDGSVTRILGILQGLAGAGGLASESFAASLGSSTGGSAFNLLSGLLLCYLAFKGSPAAQQVGVQAVAGANGLAGILQLTGVLPSLGASLGEGGSAGWLQVGVAILGFFATLLRK